MTYGEAYIKEKESIQLIKGVWTQTLTFDKKPKRMNREDAAEYYTNKINEYFGIEKKTDAVNNFDSVDDYYDYHEALRLLGELKNESV